MSLRQVSRLRTEEVVEAEELELEAGDEVLNSFYNFTTRCWIVLIRSRDFEEADA